MAVDEVFKEINSSLGTCAAIIMWCHHVMSSCDVIMWCHHVVSSCDVIMWCHHVMSSCDITLWCHHVMSSLSAVTLWCHHNAMAAMLVNRSGQAHCPYLILLYSFLGHLLVKRQFVSSGQHTGRRLEPLGHLSLHGLVVDEVLVKPVSLLLDTVRSPGWGFMQVLLYF